jgi:hypothetical protein
MQRQWWEKRANAVIGDWQYEVEPLWGQMEEMSLPEFYQVAPTAAVRRMEFIDSQRCTSV